MRRPERAARLPTELIDGDRPEALALLAIARAIDHGDLPGANLGSLMEYFRGETFETTIAEAIGRTADRTIDEGEEETVFLDAIERLRTSALKLEIDELNAKARMHGLTVDEETRRAELLATKVRLQPR